MNEQEQARITSVEALEILRARLILFIASSRQALDESSHRVQRLRVWLHDEQKNKLQHRIKQLTRVLEQREAELFTARLSTFKKDILFEKRAVHRARLALADDQKRYKRLQARIHRFDHDIEPLVRQLEPLRITVQRRLPQAVATLEKVQRTLDAYADTSRLRMKASETINEDPAL